MKRSWVRGPVDDTLAAMDWIVAPPRPLGRIAALALSFVACWYVYVPIHELLHAFGCLLTGGDVTVLEIQHQYGGALLARVFPFVEPGGEYAGRLSGFDTHGSDFVYLATDALPFVLSPVFGVPALRAATRRARPVLFGIGAVLGLAPFYNLPGDYYEMGSIVTTGALRAFGADYTGLRADDLFLLLQQLATTPESVGLASAGPTAFAIVALSLAVGVLLAFATWIVGDAIAERLVGPSHAFEARPAGEGTTEDPAAD